MLVGMALGVAVVFAVDIANHSAKRAFALSLDTVTGRSTHQLVGGIEGLDESAYIKLRTELGVRNSAPIVEGSVTLLGRFKNKDKHYSETLTLLGVDIFAEPMFREQSAKKSSSRDSLKLLHSGSVILADTTADRLGIQKGDSITIKNSSLQLELINTVDTKQQPGFENIAMADISTAQEILGSPGKLSRIDLILPLPATFAYTEAPEDQLQSDIEYIESSLPGTSVTSAARRNNSLMQMTQAFHTNLLAMSLLALLVGAFLIYNTVTLSVIQRRQTFGQLRALGVQRNELFRSIITETVLFSVLGTLAGIILGYLLGNVLLTLVTRTINDLYFTLDVRQVGYSAFTVLKACLIGLGVSSMAAFAPAIEASNSSPVDVIRRTTVERRIGKLVPKIFAAGLCLIIAGIAIILITNTSLWAGFLAIFCIVLGYSLMIPQIMITATSASTLLRNNTALNKSSGAIGNYPLRSMTASLSRTAVAIAALAVSVSATAGVGIMIGSFRLSVENWLGNTLQADIYISTASMDRSTDNPFPETLLKEIKAIDGISGIREARMTDAETNHAPARLMAIRAVGDTALHYDFPQRSNENSVHTKTTDEARMRSLLTTNSVIASETFANINRIRVGETIKITTDHGVIPFAVAGIFTNYTTGKGLLIMSIDVYRKHWNDQRIDSVGINISETANAETVKRELRSTINSSSEEMTMRSDTDIRDQSLEIFDRTFAITHVLRLLTIGVAFVGILSALMALSLERRAEYAVLRALGITPAELRKLLFVQTGLMGIIAGVLALPLGIVMSHILVSIINLRSFGWTMEYSISSRVLIESLVLAIVAALLAGLYPAYKLSRLSPAEALRDQ